MYYVRNHHPGVVSLSKGCGYFGDKTKGLPLNSARQQKPGTVVIVTERFISGLLHIVYVSDYRQEMISEYEFNMLFNEEELCSVSVSVL